MKFTAYLPFIVSMVPTVLLAVAAMVSIAEPATPPSARGRLTGLASPSGSCAVDQMAKWNLRRS
jgi:hypothetical protein